MSPSSWFRVALGGFVVVLGALLGASADDAKGKKYALLVGVTDYKGDKFSNLKYPENDVEKLAEILTKAGFTLRVLTNKRGKDKAADAPTAANVKKAIDELCEDKDRRDTVLVALSGHGANVKVDDPEKKGKPKTDSYFCPYDASLLGPSYSKGTSKFLVNLHADLFEKLEHCGARSKLVLIDACRNEFKAEAATRSLGIDKEAVPGGVSVLFSCSKDEVAWESDKLKHGVFFHFVLQGLRGKAKNDDGEVTWPRLTAYVAEQVERQVGDIVKGGASQTPHTLGNYRGTPVLVPAGKGPQAEEVVKDKDEFTNSLGIKLVRVKAGKFLMGSPKGEKDRADNEEQNEVEITKEYFIGTTEVTQKQYKAIMDKNPSRFSADGGGKDEVKGKDTDDYPVETVSWEDAQDFLKGLNKRAAEVKNKREYRLPTEAEWEYACRKGPVFKDNTAKAQLPFHFKTPSQSLGDGQANFDARYPYGDGKKGDRLERTNSATKNGEANALGLYDMHGNVSEWCSDWDAADTYKEKDRKNPQGPKNGEYRALRGGSWGHNGRYCRAADRNYGSPGSRTLNGGFRVVCVVRQD